MIAKRWLLLSLIEAVEAAHDTRCYNVAAEKARVISGAAHAQGTHATIPLLIGDRHAFSFMRADHRLYAHYPSCSPHHNYPGPPPEPW